MRPAASDSAFIADPVGTYVAGPTFLVWIARAALGGTSLWGRPSPGDARRIVALWAFDRTRASLGASVLDCRGLIDIGGETLDAARPGVERTLHDFDAHGRRHAIVIDRHGRVGALVAGLFVTGDASHPWRLHDDLASAFGEVAPGDGDLCREIERLVARHAGGPLVVRLRALLAGDLQASALPAAAAALGVSTRSLQRGLAQGGTTFRAELDAARVATATALLHQGAKLEEVATRVGSSSVPSFCAMFRRLTGRAPSELRRKPDG